MKRSPPYHFGLLKFLEHLTDWVRYYDEGRQNALLAARRAQRLFKSAQRDEVVAIGAFTQIDRCLAAAAAYEFIAGTLADFVAGIARWTFENATLFLRVVL